MKPVLILDNHFRTRDELFRDDVFEELCALCDVHGGRENPMPRADITRLLPQASYYVAARPQLTAQELATAEKLKATIEVSGAFHEGLDYAACFERGVEVLSCSPGFRNSVAEMTVAMMLAGGRGLVAEHEATRNGQEHWLDDRPKSDFTIYNQSVGFIGYGQISRETHRLLKPFNPRVMAFDPFLTDAGNDVALCDLDTLVRDCRVVVVAAVPSEATQGLLSAELIARLQPGALVVLISRAWCVDFEALIAAANAGRIQVATDVYPDEPLEADDPVRSAQNVILSPHRAAAVPGGRRLIGEMILSDVQAIESGSPDRRLKRADPSMIESLVDAQRAITSPLNV